MFMFFISVNSNLYLCFVNLIILELWWMIWFFFLIVKLWYVIVVCFVMFLLFLILIWWSNVCKWVNNFLIVNGLII